MTVLRYDDVVVARHDLHGNPRYVFNFGTTEGAASLNVRALLDRKTGDLNIYDVQADVYDHPLAEPTKSNDFGAAYAKTLKVGAGETRRVFRYILDRVRRDGFEIKSVSGERVTGARAFSDRKMAAMTV